MKSIGGKNSKVRTADQTAAAIFWTTSTPLIWNAAARAAARENGISTIDNARLFALLNFVGTDGYIAGYAIKYKYNFWRPVTAIRNAGTIGNSAISADPNWESLIITPAHPDYVSGHCISSGTPERILQKFFGKDRAEAELLRLRSISALLFLLMQVLHATIAAFRNLLKSFSKWTIK